MSSLPLYVKCLWACSFLAQVFLLYFLFAKGNLRKIPYFTAYVALNICQAGFVLFLYSPLGPESRTTLGLAWASESLTLLAQALATFEILGITLRPYKGIWGLGWRALTLVSCIVVILVTLATYSHWAYAQWFELNRGYHLTFASAVIACLLLVRYYSIPVPAAYKMILGGFCFYSCTEILINTILQAFLSQSFYIYQPIWQSARMISFIIVQIVWTAALRKPLPVETRQTASASDSHYRQMSPEINEQLGQLNEKLLQLWKLEARPH